MKHPRRSIPLLCLAILLGAVALGALPTHRHLLLPPAFPRRQTTFIPCINSLEVPR